MRILFIHAALNHLTPEYKVHLSLTENVSKEQVESYFIWQKSSTAGENPSPNHNGNIFYYDFGRDYSIVPRPSRFKRALLMVKGFPRAVYYILKQARSIQPDLVYTSQQRYDVLIGHFISRCLHIPHVIHLHYAVGPWLGKHVIRTIRSTPNLIAISEFVRQTAILSGINPINVRTVPNTISLDGFLTPMEGYNIRRDFNWADDAPLVVSVGRLEPMKGHLLLFEAFASIVKKVPEARLLVCGTSTSGTGFDNLLKERVSALKLDPYIAFAGHRRDIPIILNSADIFCLPAELEGCGLVFLEAMAAALPTVACFSGGVPEIVIHGVTGLLSYPDDIMALEENISSLLLDRYYAKCLGQAGRNRLVNEFNPVTISSKWYKTLCHIKSKDEKL